MAIIKAMETVENEPMPAPVPLHLRNPVTGLMKQEGYGETYIYPHDYPGHFMEGEHLPAMHKDKIFYEPTDIGREAELSDRLKKWWSKRRK